MTLVSFNACMAKTMASGSGNWDNSDDLLHMYARGVWALAGVGVQKIGKLCVHTKWMIPYMNNQDQRLHL
jgi:hypothetical protein